jgi:hypothetical protein
VSETGSICDRDRFAERNEPAASSASFDVVEHAIIERIHAERKAAHQQALNQLDVYGVRLNALDFEGRFRGRLCAIREAAPAAASELEAAAPQMRNPNRRDLPGEAIDERRLSKNAHFSRLQSSYRWPKGTSSFADFRG